MILSVSVVNHNMKDSYTVTLEATTGKSFKFHCPWNGYFEHLDEAEITTLYLKT